MRYPDKSKKRAIGLWWVGIFGVLNLHNFYLGHIPAGLIKVGLYAASGAAGQYFAGNNPPLANAAVAINGVVFLWNVVDLVRICRLSVDDFGKSATGISVFFKGSPPRLVSACMSENEGKAMRALARLNDPVQLAAVAWAAPLSEVRVKAVERLNDQGLLKKLAIENQDSFVQRAAVNRLTDRTMLLEVVEKSGNHKALKVGALLALGDESSLLDALFITGKHPDDPDFQRALDLLEGLPGQLSPESIQLALDSLTYTSRDEYSYRLAGLVTPEYLIKVIESSMTYKIKGMVGYIDHEIVFQACKNFSNRQIIASAYRFFKIVDGDYVKTKCEIDIHEYELIGVHEYDVYFTDEQAEKGSTYHTIYKCSKCGKVVRESEGHGLPTSTWEALRAGGVKYTLESDPSDRQPESTLWVK